MLLLSTVIVFDYLAPPARAKRGAGANNLCHVMKRISLKCVLIGTFLLGGCAYEDRYAYHDDPYYARGYDAGVDFYYVRSRPYSRVYGPLYHRGGRHYYRRGGRYIIYDRPAVLHRPRGPRIVERGPFSSRFYRGRRDWDDDDDDRRERWRERRPFYSRFSRGRRDWDDDDRRERWRERRRDRDDDDNDD
jgi:hypothetical protein